ncbi:MAG: hypothetical protein Q8N05_18335 [Bacteroidota bacterium]|nr:hypothetical protein [Bacteroidota bacterium]
MNLTDQSSHEKIASCHQKSRHDSLKCKKLLGVNISTPEGAAEASEKKLFDSVCNRLVASATEILEQSF